MKRHALKPISLHTINLEHLTFAGFTFLQNVILTFLWLKSYMVFTLQLRFFCVGLLLCAFMYEVYRLHRCKIMRAFMHTVFFFLSRNIGPALSRTVYQLYCTDGPLSWPHAVLFTIRHQTAVQCSVLGCCSLFPNLFLEDLQKYLSQIKICISYTHIYMYDFVTGVDNENILVKVMGSTGGECILLLHSFA